MSVARFRRIVAGVFAVAVALGAALALAAARSSALDAVSGPLGALLVVVTVSMMASLLVVYSEVSSSASDTARYWAYLLPLSIRSIRVLARVQVPVLLLLLLALLGPTATLVTRHLGLSTAHGVLVVVASLLVGAASGLLIVSAARTGAAAIGAPRLLPALATIFWLGWVVAGAAAGRAVMASADRVHVLAWSLGWPAVVDTAFASTGMLVAILVVVAAGLAGIALLCAPLPDKGTDRVRASSRLAFFPVEGQLVLRVARTPSIRAYVVSGLVMLLAYAAWSLRTPGAQVPGLPMLVGALSAAAVGSGLRMLSGPVPMEVVLSVTPERHAVAVSAATTLLVAPLALVAAAIAAADEQRPAAFLPVMLIVLASGVMGQLAGSVIKPAKGNSPGEFSVVTIVLALILGLLNFAPVSLDGYPSTGAIIFGATAIAFSCIAACPRLQRHAYEESINQTVQGS